MEGEQGSGVSAKGVEIQHTQPLEDLQNHATSSSSFSSTSASSQQVQTPRTGGGGNHIAALFGSVKERLWDVSRALNKSGPAYGSNGDLLPTSTPQQELDFHGVSHARRSAIASGSEMHTQPYLHGHDQVNSMQARASEGGDVASSFEDFCSIDWMPKEFFMKFRQHVEGFQLGVNFEFNGVQVNQSNTKIVFKPVSADSKWKIICEPKHGDLRLLTKKIPLGPLLSLQVGIGHDFHQHTTGWKWKLTSSFGPASISEIHHKTLLPIFPGFDVRVGWNAQYELPDMHGALGTGEPVMGMNLGHLYASIERVEAIYTHMT